MSVATQRCDHVIKLLFIIILSSTQFLSNPSQGRTAGPQSRSPESGLACPSRVDQHVAIGMATEAVQPPGSRTHRMLLGGLGKSGSMSFRVAALSAVLAPASLPFPDPPPRCARRSRGAAQGGRRPACRESVGLQLGSALTDNAALRRDALRIADGPAAGLAGHGRRGMVAGRSGHGPGWELPRVVVDPASVPGGGRPAALVWPGCRAVVASRGRPLGSRALRPLQPGGGRPRPRPSSSAALRSGGSSSEPSARRGSPPEAAAHPAVCAACRGAARAGEREREQRAERSERPGPWQWRPFARAISPRSASVSACWRFIRSTRLCRRSHVGRAAPSHAGTCEGQVLSAAGKGGDVSIMAITSTTIGGRGTNSPSGSAPASGALLSGSSSGSGSGPCSSLGSGSGSISISVSGPGSGAPHGTGSGAAQGSPTDIATAGTAGIAGIATASSRGGSGSGGGGSGSGSGSGSGARSFRSSTVVRPATVDRHVRGSWRREQTARPP